MANDFLNLTTKDDLKRLVDEGLEESLTLDYKASPALSRSGDGPNELCKDVSALANSAGGQLVYGIEEDKKKGKPARVDDGVEDEKITREWIEQILNSRIQPRLPGVEIARIDMQNGKFGYVISVRQSQSGPHQAPDRKYYRRFNLQSEAMHDYEIRDVMRRATTPELTVHLALAGGDSTQLEFRANSEFCGPFPVFCTVQNVSPQPAFHATIDILVEADIHFFHSSNSFRDFGTREGFPPMRVIRRVLNSPPDLPIYQEQDSQTYRMEFSLKWPRSTNRDVRVRRIQTIVRAPGCKKSENWLFRLEGNALTLHAPDSALTKSHRQPKSE